jgi:hypothetical protein
MTRPCIFALTILLAANPAMAAISPVEAPEAQAPRSPIVPVEGVFQVVTEHSSAWVIMDRDETELPLECRGYHVRMQSSQTATRLRRCE